MLWPSATMLSLPFFRICVPRRGQPLAGSRHRILRILQFSMTIWKGFVPDVCMMPCLTYGSVDGHQARYPRFAGENLEKNKVLYQRVVALAEKHGCTPGQLALAWVSSQGEDVAPIPGIGRSKPP